MEFLEQWWWAILLVAVIAWWWSQNNYPYGIFTTMVVGNSISGCCGLVVLQK